MASEPIHPGTVLSCVISENQITPEAFAHSVILDDDYVGLLLDGEIPMVPLVASRVAFFFGGSPRVWEALQHNYDMAADRTGT